jgi:hypothetical protein
VRCASGAQAASWIVTRAAPSCSSAGSA